MGICTKHITWYMPSLLYAFHPNKWVNTFAARNNLIWYIVGAAAALVVVFGLCLLAVICIIIRKGKNDKKEQMLPMSTVFNRGTGALKRGR